MKKNKVVMTKAVMYRYSCDSIINLKKSIGLVCLSDELSMCPSKKYQKTHCRPIKITIEYIKPKGAKK